jgi:hypothetical protein
VTLAAGSTLVLASSTLIGQSAADHGQREVRVRVATTGNHSERIETVPVSRRAGRQKRVAISMSPRRLPSLASGDRLKATAEVQVTVNCVAPSRRCVGPVYHYNPVIDARLILARRKRTTGGRGAIPISGRKREICRQRQPREHHCVIVFTRGRIEIGEPGKLSCALDGCRLNLVLDAHNRKAGRHDKIMVGGQRPDGTIPQDRGRVNAIRFHPAGRSRAQLLRTHRRVHDRLNPNLEKRVVYSQRLRGLEAGDQLAVEAKMETDISHLPYSTVIASHLILADGRRATSRGKAGRVASLNGAIDESNAFNCTRNKESCLTQKVGVLRLKRDPATRSGDQIPLYVNLVARAGPKQASASRGDRVKVTGDGGLRVVRYPSRR